MLKNNTVGRQKAIDAGAQVVDPTPEELEQWAIDVQPAIDYWVNVCKDAGINDPLSFLEAYKEIKASHGYGE